MIHLYNAKTKRIEPLRPITPNHVSMYVCGVTVYDRCHVGHARAYVAFDLLKRLMLHHNLTVNHIQNFTDIDDKIIQRSHDKGIHWSDLTKTYIDAYFEDMSTLNILPATAYPKASDHIPDMIALIDRLIQKGHAYERNGAVFFDVASDPNYGCLSHKNLDDLRSGYRIDIHEDKRAPLDFALWKPSKPTEPSWDSPWGPGRPGWHTECVAMVHHHLGQQIDIHGGGMDLKFPHHENELAQATCAYNASFVNHWVHNGFVTVDNEKMSKSLGNFFTLQDVFKAYAPDVVRFFLTRTHYRAPLNYSIDTLTDAKKQYLRLKSTITTIQPVPSQLVSTQCLPHKTAFWAALNNDMNASEAIAELFAINKIIHQHGCGSDILNELGQAIGLFYQNDATIPLDIQSMADARWMAKQSKDYGRADQLRADIHAAGYRIDDAGTTYKITKI